MKVSLLYISIIYELIVIVFHLQMMPTISLTALVQFAVSTNCITNVQDGTVWKLSSQNCGKQSHDKIRLLTKYIWLITWHSDYPWSHCQQSLKQKLWMSMFWHCFISVNHISCFGFILLLPIFGVASEIMISIQIAHCRHVLSWQSMTILILIGSAKIHAEIMVLWWEFPDGSVFFGTSVTWDYQSDSLIIYPSIYWFCKIIRGSV